MRQLAGVFPIFVFTSGNIWHRERVSPHLRPGQNTVRQKMGKMGEHTLYVVIFLGSLNFDIDTMMNTQYSIFTLRICYKDLCEMAI